MGGGYKNQDDFSATFEDGVATLTFTRPAKANAFHPRMVAPMRSFFLEVRHNPDIRVVLIRGEGKHFMAGGDLDSVDPSREMSAVERTESGSVSNHEFATIIRIMNQLDQPVVASVQGAVVGGGLGFVTACDFIIAADTAFFWAAHIMHGGTSDGLLSYYLPRQVGLRKALEMALLGDRVRAQEAKDIGLINFVVPEADLAAETARLVDRLAKGPTLGYGKIKKLMYASLGNSLAEQGALEAETYGSVLHTEDVKEGLRAFFEKRSPDFRGR